MQSGDIISSVSNSQHEILSHILHFYVSEPEFHLDVTYGNGGFYKNGTVPRPLITQDKAPKNEDCIPMDVTEMIWQSDSIKSIVFDPPFITATGRGNRGIMKERFSHFKSMADLWKFYSKALHEIHRCLEPNGILVMKCQDTVDSGKQYWSHIYVYNVAVGMLGFIAEDLFILLAKHRMSNYPSQKRARKFHSYFWVFRKRR